MINRVKIFIESNNLIKAGELVILGVSGGPDSMALLHIMSELSARMGFRIAGAHLNHGLRPEANEEEAFVLETCQEMGIECLARRVMIEQLAQERQSGLEETGRYVRYNFFEEIRQAQGGHRIATAHHSDDAAESVLLHLLRGTGIKGLRGIMPQNGAVIRPLLRVSKDELLGYLDLQKIRYCHDQTNDDQYYLRNRIRIKLIPLLQQEFNPRVVDKLNQLASIAGAENQAMEEQTESLWQRVLVRKEATTLILDNQALSCLPLAFRRRIVQKALSLLTAAEWGIDDVDYVLALSARDNVGSAQALHLKKKVRVLKSYDRMVFTIQSAARACFLHELPIPGRVVIPDTQCCYQAHVVDRRDYVPGPETIGLDYECLSPPLFLRSRQTGDYFFRPGLNGRKKLKKYLIEARVPYYDRDRIVLLTGAGQEVYAAWGLFVSNKAAITSQTRTVLRIETKPVQKSGHNSHDRFIE